MKFESIFSDKFKQFEQSEIAKLNLVVGGYKGETSKPGFSDQIQADGSIKSTADGSGKRNDGFK